ncbi:hypothetical protein [Actomonas aquatica]|uniref:Uncharacterized protein n=1 Tax=Actomonas aquatica TaxID=2866162 RepID=A0ABZ1C8W4_9BACT|nr:hypothetical protein [Opitutus sp. WL0086]WRQ88136.1 hypothetical protein K1X11_001870 [Opitutus sp. WL0086]
MKNLLNYTTLLSVAALVATATFEVAGGTVSSPLPYAVPFATFVFGLLVSTFREDYSAASRGYEPRRAKAILLPADEVFTAAKPSAVTAETPVSWTARHRRTRRAVARA